MSRAERRCVENRTKNRPDEYNVMSWFVKWQFRYLHGHHQKYTDLTANNEQIKLIKCIRCDRLGFCVWLCRPRTHWIRQTDTHTSTCPKCVTCLLQNNLLFRSHNPLRIAIYWQPGSTIPHRSFHHFWWTIYRVNTCIYCEIFESKKCRRYVNDFAFVSISFDTFFNLPITPPKPHTENTRTPPNFFTFRSGLHLCLSPPRYA